MDFAVLISSTVLAAKTCIPMLAVKLQKFLAIRRRNFRRMIITRDRRTITTLICLQGVVDEEEESILKPKHELFLGQHKRVGQINLGASPCSKRSWKTSRMLLIITLNFYFILFAVSFRWNSDMMRDDVWLTEFMSMSMREWLYDAYRDMYSIDLYRVTPVYITESSVTTSVGLVTSVPIYTR